MRYLAAMCIAFVLLFLAYWGGEKILEMVRQPNRLDDDFTVGQKMDLCGYSVDIRYRQAGYDLEQWSGERCEDLSELDECLLRCLSRAGTVKIASECYPDCVADPPRRSDREGWIP